MKSVKFTSNRNCFQHKHNTVATKRRLLLLFQIQTLHSSQTKSGKRGKTYRFSPRTSNKQKTEKSFTFIHVIEGESINSSERLDVADFSERNGVRRSKYCCFSIKCCRSFLHQNKKKKCCRSSVTCRKGGGFG